MGAKYTRQFYLRRVLYQPKFALAAAALLLEKISVDGYQLGACEDAGVPLATALSYISGRPVMTIKKQPKAYGLRNIFEGPITGDPILLIDDLAGSQNTLKLAQVKLEAR